MWKKIVLAICMAAYLIVFNVSNTSLKASQKYQPLLVKEFSLKRSNKTGLDKQVVGVFINGESKAYPIQVVGYHHYISDTIGNLPVLISYCTICRTARVYSSLINGMPAQFNLVGLNRFNAVLEDAITKSWWQQATGKAIAGPMKGKLLNEIPAQQCSLSSWLRQHPQSHILQPDAAYTQQYALMETYDKSAFKGNIIQTDSATYKSKSLVVGVLNDKSAKAYDWNKLSYVKVFEDSLPHQPVLITVENDNTSFHVYKREVKDKTLQFEKTNTAGEIKDINTASVWNMNGACIEGELKGMQLTELQSYQETRESWEDFHPNSKEEVIPTN